MLDLRALTHASPRTGIIDVLAPAVATVQLVVRSPSGSAQPPAAGLEVYTTVDAAIDANGPIAPPTLLL